MEKAEKTRKPAPGKTGEKRNVGQPIEELVWLTWVPSYE